MSRYFEFSQADRSEQISLIFLQNLSQFSLNKSVNGTQFTQTTTKTAELIDNKNEQKTKLTEEPSVLPISSIKPSVATNGYQLKAQFYSEDTKSRK